MYRSIRKNSEPLLPNARNKVFRARSKIVPWFSYSPKMPLIRT